MSRRLPDPIDVGDRLTQNYLQDLVRTLTVEISDIEGELASRNFLTSASADSRYLTSASADSRYLTSASADSRYEQKIVLTSVASKNNVVFTSASGFVTESKNRLESQFYDTGGPHTLDTDVPIVFVNATTSTVKIVLPRANNSFAVGRWMAIKRLDSVSGNDVVISEASGGAGLDAVPSVTLGTQAGFMIFGDGNNWYIFADR